MTVAQLTNPPRSHRHSNFSKDAYLPTYYSKPTTMVVTHIYTSLSLSLSKTPNSSSWNKRQTSTPIPINLEGSDSARFLLQFYLIGPFCSPYTLPPGNWVSLDPSHTGRTPGKFGPFVVVVVVVLAGKAWIGLDWIGRLRHGHGHGHGHSGFFVDFP